MRKHLSHGRYRHLLEQKLKVLERRLERKEQVDAYRVVTEILFLIDDWAADHEVRKTKRTK